MNKIEKLIQKLCPDGVEYKLLKESCDFKRGTSITKKDISKGDVPVIAGGKHPAYYHSKFNRNGETIAISGSGANAGFVSYWTQPVFLSDSFSISPKENVCIIKYLFYYLVNYQNQIYATKKGSGVPHVHVSDLYNFLIPVPPLEVQEEIVRCLDSFTALEAELKAELKARQKQYHHYREELLSFGENVPRKTLGEMGEFVRGNGLQKKDFTETGIGCIHYGQIYTYYGFSADKTKSFVSVEFAKKMKKANYDDVIIATTSENIEDVCKPLVWLGHEEVAISGDSCIYKSEMNGKFIAYYLNTQQFFKDKKKYATGTKVIRLSTKSLSKITIPVPPLAEQERIVAILDKFDTLVNDISVGLPAEIEARHKQYEYYRNKLLTFKAL